jgi:hypothetical protein
MIQMNHQPPKAASVVSRRVSSISAVAAARGRGIGEDRLNPSQTEIRCGRADYDSVRTKTARGDVTTSTRPTEAATQPTMDACAWIHQAIKTAHGGRT